VCVCVCVCALAGAAESVRIASPVLCYAIFLGVFLGSVRVYYTSRASAAPARLVGLCVVSAADTIDPLLVAVGGGIVRPSGSGASNGVGRARGNGRCFVCILRR
jgi:hypothetical protein